MADMLVDQMIDNGSYYWTTYRPRPRTVICRHCKESGLKWKWIGNHWRLYLKSEPHRCEAIKPKHPGFSAEN